MSTLRLSRPRDRFKALVHQRLDGLVNLATPIPLGSYRYHPYFLMTDLGRLASVGLAYVYLRTSGSLAFLTFLWVFLTVLAIYKLVRQTIKTYLGTAARSYLQDTVLIILPTYYCLIRYVAQADIDQAFAVFALVAPFYLFFSRLGCFFSGCCYGLPSAWGVQYSIDHFQDVQGCRRFKAAQCPAKRVLPTQLIEAFFSGLIGLLMAYLLFTQQLQTSMSVPAYFLLYCPVRFGIDFFRHSSARPRYGSLSEAQVGCLLIIFFIGFWLMRGIVF